MLFLIERSCSHLIKFYNINMNNNYPMFRSLILTLLQFDPFNLLFNIIIYTDILLSDFDSFTSIIVNLDYEAEDVCPQYNSQTIRKYKCTKELTLDEFLVDLYFEVNSFTNELDISFKFGDQYIHVFIDQLDNISTKSTFVNYLSHFSQFRSVSQGTNSYKPTDIRISYSGKLI